MTHGVTGIDGVVGAGDNAGESGSAGGPRRCHGGVTVLLAVQLAVQVTALWVSKIMLRPKALAGVLWRTASSPAPSASLAVGTDA